MLSPDQIKPEWREKYSTEKLQEMRHVCDPLADAVAAKIDRQRPSQMLDEVEARAASEGGVFKEFLDTVNQVPDWVDWDLVEQARQVSLAFANVRGMALLTSSLIEGYMGSKAVHVLVATGRLYQDVTKRIYETAQMTHNMHQKDGMRPGGAGHRIILEVRLLHAMVRKYLRAKRWDVSLYDEPINQEDMAFTIIEFDYLSIRGMERMGASLSREDRLAMHHFWRYAAWLHGVDAHFLTDSPEEEIYQYERIADHQYNPNEESHMMAMAVLGALAKKPPFYLPVELLYELARICLGDELADIYQLPRDKKWAPAIFAYKALNRATTAAHYKVPGHAALSRMLNYRSFQNILHDNLGSDEKKRAFKQIA